MTRTFTISELVNCTTCREECPLNVLTRMLPRLDWSLCGSEIESGERLTEKSGEVCMLRIGTPGLNNHVCSCGFEQIFACSDKKGRVLDTPLCPPDVLLQCLREWDAGDTFEDLLTELAIFTQKDSNGPEGRLRVTNSVMTNEVGRTISESPATLD